MDGSTLLRVTVVLQDVTGQQEIFHLPRNSISGSKFLATLMEERWNTSPEKMNDEIVFVTQTEIPFHVYRSVFDLLSKGPSSFLGVFFSVSQALQILQVSLQLLSEEGIRSSLLFIEAVPWSKEEEAAVLDILPSLELGVEGEKVLARRQILPVIEVEKDFKRLLESASSTENNPKLKKLRKVARKALQGELLPDLSIEIKKTALLSCFSKVSKIVLETLKHHEAISRIPNYIYGQSGNSSFEEAVGSLSWLSFQILDVGIPKNIYDFLVDQREGQILAYHIYHSLKDCHKTSNRIYGDIFLLLFQVMGQMLKGTVIVSPEERMKLILFWLPALDVSVVDSLLTEEISIDFNSNIGKIISTLPLDKSRTVLEAYQDLKRNSYSWLDLTEAFEEWLGRLSVQE